MECSFNWRFWLAKSARLVVCVAVIIIWQFICLAVFAFTGPSVIYFTVTWVIVFGSASYFASSRGDGNCDPGEEDDDDDDDGPDDDITLFDPTPAGQAVFYFTLTYTMF